MPLAFIQLSHYSIGLHPTFVRVHVTSSHAILSCLQCEPDFTEILKGGRGEASDASAWMAADTSHIEHAIHFPCRVLDCFYSILKHSVLCESGLC